VRRALAEARAEVCVRAQLTAEKVITDLLDIEREARADKQYSAASKSRRRSAACSSKGR
jgi:hypothetical protein